MQLLSASLPLDPFLAQLHSSEYSWTAGRGGLIATVAIFLPSFVFVSILNPLIPRLRKSTLMGSFLDAVNVSAVALMLCSHGTAGAQRVDWLGTCCDLLTGCGLLACALR